MSNAKYQYEFYFAANDPIPFEADAPLAAIQQGHFIQMVESANTANTWRIDAIESMIGFKVQGDTAKQKIMVYCSAAPRDFVRRK